MWAMGGGALTAISRSISDVRVEFGHAAFPLGRKAIFLKSTINTVFCYKVIQAACVLLIEQSLTCGLWWPRCVWARCRSSRSPQYKPRPARGWSSGVLCSWVGNGGFSLVVFPADISLACPLGFILKKHLKASLICFPLPSSDTWYMSETSRVVLLSLNYIYILFSNKLGGQDHWMQSEGLWDD